MADSILEKMHHLTKVSHVIRTTTFFIYIKTHSCHFILSLMIINKMLRHFSIIKIEVYVSIKQLRLELGHKTFSKFFDFVI